MCNRILPFVIFKLSQRPIQRSFELKLVHSDRTVDSQAQTATIWLAHGEHNFFYKVS